MAGYSSTPLQKKLGIRAGTSLFIQNAPPEYFNWVSPLPKNVKIKKANSTSLDFIHCFVRDEKTFKKLFIANKKRLDVNGMMWISWPKKSSGMLTDLNENVIRDFGLQEGLVDVKVCAVDETWSALKFVYRLEDR